MRNSITTSLTTTSLVLALAGAAHAQSLTSSDPVDSKVDAIADATTDAFDDGDAERFGNASFSENWQGNLFVSGSLTSGNTDTADLSIGSRVSRTTGAWNQTVSLAYEYGEADGDTSKNSIFALYDVNRSLTERMYGFALLRGEKDFELDTNDAFLGFGLGYRILNERDHTWRVQAGPGYRVSGLSAGGDFDEAGISASSRYFVKLNNGMSITNDTDVIWSDSDTLVSNDLGLNVSVSGPLALRLGLNTEYNSDPGAGLEKTDTTTTVSVVYNF